MNILNLEWLVLKKKKKKNGQTHVKSIKYRFYKIVLQKL